LTSYSRRFMTNSAPAALQRPGAGTEGRPSMQWQPTAGTPVPSSRVGGLGVCDVLRIEFAPTQLLWLIDQLEEMRSPLEREFERLLARPRDPQDDETARELEAARYKLRLLRMIRAEVPAADHADAVVVVGPSEMLLDVVRGAMRRAVDDLGTLAHGVYSEPSELSRLRDIASAVRAWVETLVECEAVEGFRFDPDADPPPGD